jgi:carbon monoxide dehydrogenase subunit G
MDVSGSHKIKAARPVVFQALLNPEVLKNSVPGCEAAEFVDFPSGRQLKLTITPKFPGISGSHDIFLQTGEIVEPSRVVLIAEPSSALGSIKAVCTVDLADDAAGTEVKYNAQATLEGKIAATPELIIKPAVKVALDQFFKNFEKQVGA